MTRWYRVKEVADLAGVSVRTLHHYDELGLLVPSSRTDSGYRLYSDDDLLRLQQILIGRELGMSLEEIHRSLDDPLFDRKQALLAQRRELEARVSETEAMIRAVDKALAALEEPTGGNMDMKEIFDGFDPSKYEKEVEERWGKTEAYAESKRRTQKYTKEDWAKLRDEQAAIYRDLLAAMNAGKKPDEAEVMDIAERARLSIERWFYPCSLEMHAGLADMYEADPRFAENIDKFGAGLTPYLSAAIRANSARPRTRS